MTSHDIRSPALGFLLKSFFRLMSRKSSMLCVTQQIGVHEASLCVLPGSSTKLTSVLMLCAWCVFHVFSCALSVYTSLNITYHSIILGSCVFALSLRCYRTRDSELKMVSDQHIVNTKMSWTHASTSTLGILLVTGIHQSQADSPGKDE